MESTFHPEALTWTGLLGRWIEFAQASVALPYDAEGERWRKSVTPIINLQAVSFALGDLVQLAPWDRPHSRDRAAVLIRDNTAELFTIWAGEALPPMLREMMDDADAALERASYVGSTELIWPGPDPLVMPEINLDLEKGGTVAVMQPGTIVMPNEPVAWWLEREAPALPSALNGAAHREPDLPRQVYRVLDEQQRMVRDIVLPVLAEPPAGEMMPLLVPLVQDGRKIGSFTMNAEEWERAQRDAIVGETCPVEFHDGAA